MTLPVTPAQTIGPFYGYALPFPDGENPAPAGHPETVTVHGRVLDGLDQPVPDALLEFWQTAPDGSRTGRPGSLRRDRTTGGYLGRNGVDFTGFARIATDADGHYTLRTLQPGGAPYLTVCLFARGLTHQLFTRVYLPGHPLLDGDRLRAALTAGQRDSLTATAEDARTYRFDIRLQGEKETTFLVFP